MSFLRSSLNGNYHKNSSDMIGFQFVARFSSLAWEGRNESKWRSMLASGAIITWRSLSQGCSKQMIIIFIIIFFLWHPRQTQLCWWQAKAANGGPPTYCARCCKLADEGGWAICIKHSMLLALLVVDALWYLLSWKFECLSVLFSCVWPPVSALDCHNNKREQQKKR